MKQTVVPDEAVSRRLETSVSKSVVGDWRLAYNAQNGTNVCEDRRRT